MHVTMARVWWYKLPLPRWVIHHYCDNAAVDAAAVSHFTVICFIIPLGRWYWWFLTLQFVHIAFIPIFHLLWHCSEAWLFLCFSEYRLFISIRSLMMIRAVPGQCRAARHAWSWFLDRSFTKARDMRALPQPGLLLADWFALLMFSDMRESAAWLLRHIISVAAQGFWSYFAFSNASSLLSRNFTFANR